MSHFADLTPCSRRWIKELREVQNVGWLDPAHGFDVGPVAPEFVSRLAVLCVNGTLRTMSLYRCGIPPCPTSVSRRPASVVVDGVQWALGSGEIVVGLPDGRWFVAPNLIHHYVTGHGYRPPEEFIEAVLGGLVHHEGISVAQASVPGWRADLITHVGGLALPQALVRAISEGRWEPPSNEQVLIDVFGEEPEDPRFYDFASLPRQNENLDRLVVLIGDMGTDSPIALDYRIDRENPRVIYMRSGGWHVVAADFEELESRLGLRPGLRPYGQAGPHGSHGPAV